MTRTTRNITAPTVRPHNKKISVIIPAAGYGSRMKFYGPKSLIKIKDDTRIIDNQLQCIFKCLKQPQIIMVAGFKYPKVKEAMKNKQNVLVVENEQWETTNVVSSIGIGLDHAKYEDILLVYGDLVFNIHALKVGFGPNSMILTDKHGLMKDEEVGCIVQNHMLEHMMYSLPNKWAQIAYFTGKESDMLKEICTNNRYENYFGFEIINMIMNSGGKFSAYSNPKMKITDIDSSKDLEKIGGIL